MGWFDPRLTFAHLKNSTSRNIIGRSEMDSVWLLPMKFSNSANNQKVSHLAEQDWLVVRHGDPQTAPLSVVDEIYTYFGSENMLVFRAEYELTFSCQFQLHCYPFDTQKCTIEVSRTNCQNRAKICWVIHVVEIVLFRE